MKEFLKRLRAIVYSLLGEKRYRRLKFLPRWDRADVKRLQVVVEVFFPPKNGEDPQEYFFLVLFRLVFAFVGFSVVIAVVSGWYWGSVWFPFHEFFPDEIPGDWEQSRNFALTLAGVVGAVFGLFQLHNSAARTRLNRIDTETKRGQERNERERERNERFVRASELLSHDDASVRMAGVYALGRLALEPDGNYDDTVLEVLAGFVRERTTRNPEEWGDKGYPSYPAVEKPAFERGDDLEASLRAYKKELDEWLEAQKPPTEPVRAAMNVVSRILRQRPRAKPVDFSGAVLIKAKLDGFHFRNCNFTGARLEGAGLRGAHLQGAQLRKAHLEGAQLWGAHLERAVLVNARLEGADLSGARLERADLSVARLEGADLRGARLEGADLAGARLEGADLRGARLEGAFLGGAGLEGAVLLGADLSGVTELTEDQLDAAVWPTDNPPKLPDKFKAERFDKSAYTDPEDPRRLLFSSQWPERAPAGPGGGSGDDPGDGSSRDSGADEPPA